MRVDALASEPHYLDHLLPVWRRLSGRLHLAGRLADDLSRARDTGATTAPISPGPAPVLVASWADYERAALAGRRIIYLEHGAGQTYDGDANTAGHVGYSGSGGHEACILFICPSETVAARWRARYPGTPAVAVGCPKMDRWLDEAGRGHEPDHEIVDRGDHLARVRTVAVSFHADARWTPETTSTWRYWQSGFPGLASRARDNDWRLLGHGHPRLWRQIEPIWRRYGIEPVEDFEEVLARADLYAADNTSTLPEFASTGRPVLWLSAPWYRRDFPHGGRFWDWPAGQIECDTWLHLADCVEAALMDPPSVREGRERMVAAVYAYTDGRAAERAAAAILALG